MDEVYDERDWSGSSPAGSEHKSPRKRAHRHRALSMLWEEQGASCALFFVCANEEDDERVPVCLLFLCLCCVSLAGAGAVCGYLLFSRPCATSSSDPITGVGVADTVLSLALVSGAATTVSSPDALTRGARDGLFHVAYASFLASCSFAFGSAHLVHGRLSGRTLSMEVEEKGDERLSEDGSAEPPVRGKSRKLVAATYASAAVVSFLTHVAERSPRVVGFFVLVPGVIVACLLAYSLHLYWRVARLSGVSYPRAQLDGVRRAIACFALAHSAKALFVASAAVVASSERLFFVGCRPGTGWTERPVSRAIMEIALATIGSLDAIAVFSNSPWYVSPSRSRSAPSLSLTRRGTVTDTVSWAPLTLLRVDDQRLLAAPVIGRGTFGTVRKLGAEAVSIGRLLLDAGVETVAVKSFAHTLGVDLSAEDTWVAQQLELLRIEAFQIAKLHHWRIVPLYGIAESESLGPCLVSEYLDGGSLSEHLQNPASRAFFERHDPFVPRRVARHVADALAYLHSKHVIHRDLKSANVLVSTAERPDRWRFKVCDFGTSRVLLDNASSKPPPRQRSADRALVFAAAFFDVRRGFWWTRRRERQLGLVRMASSALPNSPLLTTQVGTPLAMAPELLLPGDGAAARTGVVVDYDAKIDVYSFAILLWEICARSTNWYAEFHEDPGPGCAHLFRHVLAGLRPRVRDDFDPHLADLMCACWDHRPQHRPDFDAIHADLVRLLHDERSAVSPSPFQHDDEDDHHDAAAAAAAAVVAHEASLVEV